MNRRAIAAEQIYLGLKADLGRGRYAPGAILNIHMVATETGVSVSPVRDAMERLVGERLIALREEGGFHVPHIDLIQARDFYQWHSKLVRLALRDRRQPIGDGTVEPFTEASGRPGNAAIVSATSDLFEAVARATVSSEHLEAVRAASDRLAPLRHRETCLRNRADELLDLWLALLTNNDAKMRSSVTKYHTRRLRALPNIVSGLYAPE